MPASASRRGTRAAPAHRNTTGRRIARARHRVLGRLPRWARGGVLTAAAGAGILVIALAGGLMSGKLEHRPTVHVAPPPPAATTPPTTTTASSEPAPAVQAVKQALVNAMNLDLLAQRLDPDPTRRLAVAESPADVARRHTDITVAWAPDKVAGIIARYDALVRANATDRTQPALTGGEFVVKDWDDVTITGSTARATCHGHYRLVRTTGTVGQPDQAWVVNLTLSGGRWRMSDRTAT